MRATLPVIVALLLSASALSQPTRILTVSGTILDEFGQPLAGAYVVALEAHDEREAPTGFRSSSTRRHPERDGVLLIPRSGTMSDDDGTFEIRVASGGSGEWFLDATRRSYVPVQGLALGENVKDIDVRMTRTGSVAGRVIVDPGVDEYRIAATIAGQRRLVSFDGTFEFDGLPPGVHDVAFLFGFDQEPAVTVGAVEIVGGERTMDDRLFPIDLRGVARTLTLDVVDETGHPVHGFYVAPLGRTDISPWFSSDYTITIPTRQAGIDVAVAGFPTRVARVRGAIGRRRVVLSPPAVIELALAGGTTVPDPPMVLVPFVQRADEDAALVELIRILERSSSNGVLDGLRRATAQVIDLGVYRVGWALLADVDQPVAADRLVSPLVEVHVRDTASPPVIPVSIDERAYHELLRQHSGS